MNKYKKEVYIFLVILVVLTIGIHHKELLENPIGHISKLPNAGAYGLGAIHPIVFTTIIYILIGIPRLISKLIRKK